MWKNFKSGLIITTLINVHFDKPKLQSRRVKATIFVSISYTLVHIVADINLNGNKICFYTFS